ncbi:hypothetical protein KJ359_006589 [Pestalotiopsis sp. 9143b]|nr:hypothetical protein KJ359_006589 [Pestalotiopsis sp. 9143b]
MAASTLVTIYTFTTSFGKVASREGWHAAVADATEKQQKKNSPKHSTGSSKCANGTCAKCYLKEHLARRSKYQRLSEEGNDGFGNW